jgi:hypothetical protein
MAEDSTHGAARAAIKLNLGCGYDKRSGWVNVDSFAGCHPDVVCNLESFPWPWDENSVDEVAFVHSLEHLGGQVSVFLGIIQELYRVCQNDASIEIRVPHPRHDSFIGDPTHVRAITPDLLRLFDKEQCKLWAEMEASNSRLAYQLSVDFYEEKVAYVPDPLYAEKMRNGEVNGAELEAMMRERNNIASEIYINLRARKPWRD